MNFKQERKKFSSFVEIFDLYGHSFNLHIFGKEKYKTLIGCIISCLSLMLIVSVALYFIVDLFQRKSMTVIYNEDLTKVPSNNLSDTPIMLTLSDYTGQLLETEGIYTLDVNIMNYKNIQLPDGKTYFGLEIVPIKMEKCDLAKHFLGYVEMFKSIEVSKWFCIPPNKYNLTLHGRINDLVNGWSSLNIYVNKCNPKIEKCLNSTFSDNLLQNFVTVLAFLSNSIDHYNTTSPNSLKVETITFTMSTSIFKNWFLSLRENNYKTDYGFIFEDFETKIFFSYDYYFLDVAMANTGIATSGQNMGYISIKSADTVYNYSRAYIKGQAVMANIGGIIKAIMIMAKIVSDFLTHRMSYVDLSNAIFEFDLDEKISQNKKGVAGSTHLTENNNNFYPKISKFENKISKSKDPTSKTIINNQNILGG
jgi:hypothetical protein